MSGSINQVRASVRGLIETDDDDDPPTHWAALGINENSVSGKRNSFLLHT